MKLCECGCGEEVTNHGNRFINGHNRNGKKHTDVSIKKMVIKQQERFNDPLEHEKVRERTIKQYEDPVAHEKTRAAAIKRYENPEEREKSRISAIKRYEKLYEHEKSREAQLKRYEDPKQIQKQRDALDTHHYIYDFNDLNKYTIKISKSEHLAIHNRLRSAGLEVPYINIMNGD